MQTSDCLIVGGGPAGLTAAIYAARFHLSVRLIDSGRSRAAAIPCTRNHAGFPEGIAGAALLERMRAQAMRYGVKIEAGRVDRLAREGDVFVARRAGRAVHAKAVLLATGVVNRRPEGMDDDLHDAALAAGRIRYCPVCDGYEVTDQRIAVIGDGAHGAREALFLRAYSRDVTLISSQPAHDLDADQLDRLSAADVRLIGGPSANFALSREGIELSCGGESLSFEAIYPALGSSIHSELALGLGAKTTAEGCIVVDGHQRTSIPGLYAAGDVVKGLDQISHAMGEAGVAATTIRNDLAAVAPRLR